MRCEISGPTKVLIADELPERAVQLAAWAAEWGFNPMAINAFEETPEEADRIREPWLGIFSHLTWRALGQRLTAVSEILPGAAPCFSVVILQSPEVLSAPHGAGAMLWRPFQPSELQVGLSLGSRILGITLERNLQAKQLEKARAQLSQLEGMLPICMDCKRIRDERDRWQPIEHYISARSRAAFTHGLCPVCFQKRVREFQPAA